MLQATPETTLLRLHSEVQKPVLEVSQGNPRFKRRLLLGIVLLRL